MYSCFYTTRIGVLYRIEYIWTIWAYPFGSGYSGVRFRCRTPLRCVPPPYGRCPSYPLRSSVRRAHRVVHEKMQIYVREDG